MLQAEISVFQGFEIVRTETSPIGPIYSTGSSGTFSFDVSIPFAVVPKVDFALLKA
jgi:hypothetical protein